MNSRLKTLFAATFIAASSISSAANTGTIPSDMYVVMFRADWCPPCKVVEPRLKNALGKMGDHRIEYVEIDITDHARTEISAHKAFDRQIVAQYNMWYRITGFAVVIDADTKQTLGCINSDFDQASMQLHLKNLKTYAISNQVTQKMDCPPAYG